MTITTSANPSTYFDNTTMNFTVAPVAPGPGTPTGNIRLIPGNGLVTLSGGKATVLVRDTTPGTVTFTALYNGDANFAGSSSAPFQQTVQKAAPPSADVAISPSGTVVFGTPITVTVTFTTLTPIQRMPSGTVTVNPLDGNGNGTKTLSGGKVVFATTAGANPSGTYGAVFNGDAYYLPATLPTAKISVKKAGSVVSLGALSTDVTEGDTISLIAAVSSPDSANGTVSIYDGATLIASGIQVSNGQAPSKVKAAGPGKHTFRATFTGTANVDGSSGTVDITVRARPAGAAAPATTTATDTAGSPTRTKPVETAPARTAPASRTTPTRTTPAATTTAATTTLRKPAPKKPVAKKPAPKKPAPKK